VFVEGFDGPAAEGPFTVKGKDHMADMVDLVELRIETMLFPVPICKFCIEQADERDKLRIV
jgi:hypothetical protein